MHITSSSNQKQNQMFQISCCAMCLCVPSCVLTRVCGVLKIMMSYYSFMYDVYMNIRLDILNYRWKYCTHTSILTIICVEFTRWPTTLIIFWLNSLNWPTRLNTYGSCDVRSYRQLRRRFALRNAVRLPIKYSAVLNCVCNYVLSINVSLINLLVYTNLNKYIHYLYWICKSSIWNVGRQSDIVGWYAVYLNTLINANERSLR